MRLLLVRHAKATSRQRWRGDDRRRPLTAEGSRQAGALVHMLSGAAPARILSSPYLRCTETVEPLASELGIDVERCDELAEGDPAAAVALMRSVTEPAVVACTHGDVVPEILASLSKQDGLVVPPDAQWAKGSTWVLTGEDGRFVRGAYIAPPPG